MGNFREKIRQLFRRSAAGWKDDLLTTGWPWEALAAGTAANLSTVYQCVNVMCRNVGRLPLQICHRHTSGVYLPQTEGWLNFILNISPNEYFSGYDFWSQAVRQVKYQGNAYIIPQWAENPFGRERCIRDLLSLILCSPNSVTYDRAARLYRVNDSVWGVRGDFHPGEIIHLKEPSHDGLIGVSPLTKARITIDTALAGDVETRDRFANGGNVRGFITNPPVTATGYNQYSKEALEKAAKEKDAFFRAGGRITSIAGAAEFHQLMMTSADMQFLESRRFTVIEICRWFGVPPSFVFEGSSSNYKESQKVRSDFVTDTLEPLLVQFELELRRKLLTFSEMDRYQFKFDRSGLASSDPEAAVKLSSQRISAGIDTPNEARKAMGRPPVDGGDTVLMSANLKTIPALVAEGDPDGGETEDENEDKTEES